MKRDVVLSIFVIFLSISSCGAVVAHPGHGTPIEEPSDPGTGGSTDTGTTGSTTSGTSSSSSASTSTGSDTSGYGSTTETQYTQTGPTESQASSIDNTQTQIVIAPEEVIENSESSNSAGGPVAMIGLIMVIGLIAISFPYNEGGALHKIQMNLFGR